MGNTLGVASAACYANFGYDVFPATRDQFNAFIQAESSKYADVVKRAKASLD